MKTKKSQQEKIERAVMDALLDSRPNLSYLKLSSKITRRVIRALRGAR